MTINQNKTQPKNTFKRVILSFFLVFLWIVEFQAQEHKIDHVIILTPDLNTSVKNYIKEGFTFKNGRKHKNGIENAHIKFKNKSYIEFISLYHEPKDNLAKKYHDLLGDGEKGVFIVLSGLKIEAIAKKVEALNITFEVIKSKHWNYLTFEKEIGLSHIFFIENNVKTQDSTHLFNHSNNSKKIKSVHINGNDLTLKLLEAIGLNYLGLNSEKHHVFYTHTGNIILNNSLEFENTYINKIIFENATNEKSYQINF